MNPVSRKDFLRLTSLGFLASLLPTQQINAFSFILDSKKIVSQDDYAEAVALSYTAKKYFHEREYQRAEEAYRECIRLAPSAVRFYDGLDNVLGAQGKFLETLLLYKNGLEVNNQNVAFFDRTARALMRIELGYKKISEEYRNTNNSTSMLEDGLKLYEEALLIDPSKRYLEIGKVKIEDKIRMNAAFIDFRKEVEYKKAKRQKAIEANKSIYLLPTEIIIQQYNDIDTKKRRIIYFEKEKLNRDKVILKEKKRKSQVVVDKFLENKDYTNAIIWSKTLFNLDKKNQHAIVRLKKSFYGVGKFNDFVNYRLEYAKSVKKVYAYLGVLDAIQKSIEKRQHTATEMELAHTIGEDLLKNWGLMENLAIDVLDKYSKILILDNQMENAVKLIENALSKVTFENEERINKLLCTYANLFFESGNFQDAIQLLQMSLKEEVNYTNTVIRYDLVKQLSEKKIDNSFLFNKPIYYFLYKCYKITNNQQLASEILDKIRSNDYNDPFLLNKI